MVYLTLFAIVFGVNLLPAFGPPTWSIIVFFELNHSLPIWALVAVAASASALGRLSIAYGARMFAGKLPQKMQSNLDTARDAIQSRKHNVWIGLGLFALSPLPSGQLFMAVGLARIPLLSFTAAFFLGRTVSYTIYALGARTLKKSELGDVFSEGFTSPWGIALQIVMLGLLVALTQVDWAKLLGKGRKP
jgi:membrane protein YqaA with SNARE-associated domain